MPCTNTMLYGSHPNQLVVRDIKKIQLCERRNMGSTVKGGGGQRACLLGGSSLLDYSIGRLFGLIENRQADGFDGVFRHLHRAWLW